MENNYEKLEIEKIKQKLKTSLNNKQINENISEDKSSFSSNELSSILKKIKVKSNLLDTVDTEFSFGGKQLSLTSYLFNKQISQKYLNALKYFILREPLEKQNEINLLLIDLVTTLVKQLEDKSKSMEDVLTRLEKIEKYLKIN